MHPDNVGLQMKNDYQNRQDTKRILIRDFKKTRNFVVYFQIFLVTHFLSLLMRCEAKHLYSPTRGFFFNAVRSKALM